MKSKPKNIHFLIAFLTFVATALTIWRLFFFRPLPESNPPAAPTPIPTATLEPTISPSTTITPITTPLKEGLGDSPEELKKKLLEKFPLYDSVPYEEETFSLDYVGPLHLRIVLKADTPEVRKAVSDWIWSKEVNPSTHQIDWKIKP